MSKKKNTAFYMKASRDDKSNIVRLARRLHVSKSQAVRLAVAHMLQSSNVPQLPRFKSQPR